MQEAQCKFEDALVPLFAGDQGKYEAEAHAHLLGQLIGLDYRHSPHIRHILDDARQIRNRGFNAAVQALRRIGAQGGLPLVIQIDDLHWVDDASLDFIDYLQQVDGDVPLLLLALTRPALFERRQMTDLSTRVDVAPLGRHAAEREREISGRIRLLTHLRRVIARQPMPRARRAIDAGKGTGVVAQGAASPETRNALAVRPHHSHDAA